MNNRFWSKVDVRGDDECWMWQGTLHRQGYGMLRWDDKQTFAHRVAYALTNGPIPAGLIICHSCDVPGCCNPAHLFLGTYKDNSQDRDRKGRAADRKGTRNGQAKITEEQVVFAMARMLTGREEHQQIAAAFGVSKNAMSKIWLGRKWQHLWGVEWGQTRKQRRLLPQIWGE
jgi:hypothetical protein